MEDWFAVNDKLTARRWSSGNTAEETREASEVPLAAFTAALESTQLVARKLMAASAATVRSPVLVATL